ncbi:MAG TPA: 50S ribosomal protein L37ae [archaeon]|nr:50S ribosomal protein L37ae [archaeon]
MPGKIGSFGPRYGNRAKKIILQIETMQKQSAECPHCERKSLKRVAAGIWTCQKCGVKFAGAAYLPKSVKKV